MPGLSIGKEEVKLSLRPQKLHKWLLDLIKFSGVAEFIGFSLSTQHSKSN